MDDQAKSDAILKLGKDRRLAHAVLFAHRHPDATPEFHHDMIALWGSQDPRVLIMALREGAKSTVGEEEVVLDALYQRFHNALIVGETFDRAADRLRAIKHELETNEFLIELFGGMKGHTWNEDKIVMQNGICIQAKGRDQSFRGIKHLDWRPDFLWVDDYEDKESVKTPDSRKFWLTNFMTVILPALDKRARVRVTGTPLDEDCMLYNLEKERMLDAKPRWTTRRYPIEYKGHEGERVSIWPSRYPVEHIDNLRASYEAQGLLREYNMEYMVEASNPELQRFKAEYIRIKPHIRTWHPTLAVYDPARTVKRESSSMTGHVVASWVGNKVVVWESDGRFMLPNEMIDDLFRVEDTYGPVEIGVEQDGLNEWVMQPLRQEQTKRRTLLPLRALKAPKGKLEFIGAMQSFFQAGEVEFASEMPELKKQLLSFPTGRLDVPNALAYIFMMRPGLPMLDGFGALNVTDELARVRGRPYYLVLNADLGVVTGVLCQHVDGSLWVIADWVREGAPGDVLMGIVTDASLEIQGTPRAVIGAEHFGAYNTTGLVPATRRASLDMMTGADKTQGREELRKLMQTMRRGQSALLVSSKASWTLRATAGGYARQVVKGGGMTGEPVKNVYRVLMEGLESFAALLPGEQNSGMESTPHYAVNERGVRYMTALPR